MPRKEKESCCKDSTDELSGTQDSKEKKSLSGEKTNPIRASLQLIQGQTCSPDVKQSSVGEDNESGSKETSNKSKSVEQIQVKSKEKTTKADCAAMPNNSKDTEKNPTETDQREKSVKRQVDAISKASSPHLLKWSNNPVTPTKGKKKKVKKKEEKQSRQTEVSEYFAVRRSGRKSKSVIQNEKQRALEQALLSGKEQDLEVQDVEGKGRGVFTTRDLDRGQFVCEYAGELISYETAKEREKFYEGKTEFGCYMYYFNFKNKKLCVDATKESGRLGRLLNHSRTDANCATKLVSVKDKPYLILETIKDVKAGEELVYDYGERSKDVLQHHEWLKC